MGFLWFTALSRLNVKLDVEKTSITKYHHVTNLAINAAIKTPYGGRDTPRTRLLWSIAKVLDGLSDEDWDLDKEMIGWGLGESPVLLPPVLPPAEDVFGEEGCLLESLKTTSRFHSKSMYRVSLSFSVSSAGRDPASTIWKMTRF